MAVVRLKDVEYNLTSAIIRVATDRLKTNLVNLDLSDPLSNRREISLWHNFKLSV